MNRPPNPVPSRIRLLGTLGVCAVSAALLVGCGSSPAVGSATAPPGEGAAAGAPRFLVREATWPTVAPQGVLPLSAASWEALGRSPVPVLLPGAGRDGTLTAGEHWYAYATELDGTHVVVQGTRAAYDYGAQRGEPSPQPSATVRGRPVFVIRNEGIWTAAWSEYGVEYSLSLECGAPEGPRCTDERAVLDLVRGLVYAGGRGPGTVPATSATPLPEVSLPTLLPQAAGDFTYNPAGTLQAGSGYGARAEYRDRVYAPGIQFPVESAQAYANSQVYGVGGSKGPAGSEGDARNFRYPWWDNYCEPRDWKMPMCQGGTGHQGQDIRAATAEPGKYPALAVRDGTVTAVGSYHIELTASDGTVFRYLHLEMNKLLVRTGTAVKRGQRLGYVGNDFGGTSTTVHLHFDIMQNVSGLGVVFVPPYPSLVAAYRPLPTVGHTGNGDLTAGEGLMATDDRVYSPSGNFELRLQRDGNLVLYRTSNGQVMWATYTNGQSVHRLVMQNDGNLVLYSTTNGVLWQTGTQGNFGASLAVQDDGNLVIYDQGKAIWWR